MSLALGVLAPWLVKILAPSSPAFYRADEAVGLLAFAASAYAGYTVLAIGIGRARRTQFNWIVSGVAAVAEHRAQLRADPALRDDGRGGLDGRRLRRAVRRDDDQRAARLPGAVPVAPRADAEQRRNRADRRSATCPARSLLAIALCLVYPLLLLPLGFYLPAERARLRRLVPLGS